MIKIKCTKNALIGLIRYFPSRMVATIVNATVFGQMRLRVVVVELTTKNPTSYTS